MSDAAARSLIHNPCSSTWAKLMHPHALRMGACMPPACCMGVPGQAVDRALTMRACMQVASSFSHMLNLHNLTEEVNASQTERAVRLGEVRAHGKASHPTPQSPAPCAPSVHHHADGRCGIVGTLLVAGVSQHLAEAVQSSPVQGRAGPGGGATSRRRRRRRSCCSATAREAWHPGRRHNGHSVRPHSSTARAQNPHPH
jgi:hypothetical protein